MSGVKDSEIGESGWRERIFSNEKMRFERARLAPRCSALRRQEPEAAQVVSTSHVLGGTESICSTAGNVRRSICQQKRKEHCLLAHQNFVSVFKIHCLQR